MLKGYAEPFADTWSSDPSLSAKYAVYQRDLLATYCRRGEISCAAPNKENNLKEGSLVYTIIIYNEKFIIIYSYVI